MWDNIFCVISVLLNLPRLVLWPGIWSFLVNVSCALENDVCSAIVGCSVYWWQGKVFDSVLQDLCIITAFLYNCSMISWEISVEMINYGSLYFLSVLSVLGSCIFEPLLLVACTFRIIVFSWWFIFYLSL